METKKEPLCVKCAYYESLCKPQGKVDENSMECIYKPSRFMPVERRWIKSP